MSKKVNRGARIVLGNTDISEYVVRWSVGGEVGGLYVAEIDILDYPQVIVIDREERRSVSRNTAKGGAQVLHKGVRVPLADKVLIKGTDISRWIGRYDHITRPGEADIIRLYVQCDSEVLSINNTTPWEDQL